MYSLGHRFTRIALLAGLVAAGTFISLGNSARAAGTCDETWKPVCAKNSGGFMQVYSSACWAKMNKAKVMYSGMCKWK
jgi:hypothetical protein